jgi:hypothetical protein
MKVNDAVVLAGASGGLGRAVSEALPQAEELLPGCRGKPYREPQLGRRGLYPLSGEHRGRSRRGFGHDYSALAAR